MPFTEAKCRILPLWCWLLALQKPRGPGAQSGACPCESSSSVHENLSCRLHCRAPHSPTQGTRKNPNQQQQKNPRPLPIQSHLSTLSYPEECAPQAETLYFKEHIVQKHFITWQRHPFSMLASQQIYSLREKNQYSGCYAVT